MISLIMARGGSKSIPNKNIKKLLDRPLIVYTIEAAKKAKSVEKIILSTDDEKIAEIARNLEVKIPFMRPGELATDNALAIDNYIYTIQRLNTEYGENCKEFVSLPPTSPLRTAEDIDNAIDIFYEKKADSVISVCEAFHPPLWAKEIDDQGILRSYFPFDVGNKNRQELKKAYVPNGAVFVFKFSLLKEKYTFYSEKTYPYVMPKERSIDIDSEFDFDFAEYLIKKNV